MPRYDYSCPYCGYEAEVLQYSMTEVISCIACGTAMNRKFPSGVMVKMKGEGGFPARRKQIFNTTQRLHPKLS